MGFLGYYVELANAEKEKVERALLASLQAKYDGSTAVSSLPSLSPLQAPLSIQLQPPPATPAEVTYLADISDEAERVDEPQYSLFA